MSPVDPTVPGLAPKYGNNRVMSWRHKRETCRRKGRHPREDWDRQGRPLDFLTLVEGINMFTAGKSGNPGGRPKGSYGGRIMALASLDRLLAKKKNQKAMMDALEKDLQENPVGFFRNVVMPLLPREARLSLDREGVIQWTSLLGATDSPPAALEARGDGEAGSI